MSADSFSREPVSFMDGLAGPTQGDNVRHLIVRSAFLEVLLAGEPWQALYESLAKASGLIPLRDRAAVTLAAFAEITGYHNRYDAWMALGEEEFIVQAGGTSSPEYVEAAYAQMSDSISSFFDGMIEFSSDLTRLRPVVVISQEFVLRLKLPWLWLSLEIIQAFLLHTYALVFRMTIERNQMVRFPPEPTLQSNVEVTVPAGATGAEARTLLITKADELQRSLLHKVIPRGRMPDRDIPKLERDGRWFYRAVVAKEPIYGIAKTSFAGVPNPEMRTKDVRDGIKSARRLLEMTPYELTAPGEYRRKPSFPRGKV